MRKLTTGLLVAASALALAGCEKKEEAPAAPAEDVLLLREIRDELRKR